MLILRFLEFLLKDASKIIDDVYDKHANASQRASMVEEFYGPEFAVFKVIANQNWHEINIVRLKILCNSVDKNYNLQSSMRNFTEYLTTIAQKSFKKYNDFVKSFCFIMLNNVKNLDSGASKGFMKALKAFSENKC